MVKLFWSLQSKEDLKHIYDFIAADSKKYAKIHVNNLIASTRALKEFPKMGRIVPEFESENIRELLFKNYRIVYLLEEEKSITVLTVFHGSKPLDPQAP